jgi:hypothetical protein
MPIRTLAEAISHYGYNAYLLTVAQDGPHTSHVTIELRGSSIGCALGASAARNIAREPHMSLFWPPTGPGGYALIVNGAAAGERRTTVMEITLTKSALHRPGPRPLKVPSSDTSGAGGPVRIRWRQRAYIVRVGPPRHPTVETER